MDKHSDGMKEDANQKHIPTCTEEKHEDDQHQSHRRIPYGFEDSDIAED